MRRYSELLQDIAHMDGGRRGAPFDDLAAVSAQIVRCDLCQETIPPDGHFAFEDGATHRACAIGHGRVGQPFLAELAEALCFLDPALLPLLLDGGRPPFGDRAPRVDA